MSQQPTSLDPRVNRLDLKKITDGEQNTNTHWITWEVFHQEKKGKQAVHVGVVHAPSVDMAVLFAKEAFARRGKTTNVWVVKTSDIYTVASDDEDMFETTPEKLHREPASYKVRDRIEAYRTKNKL